MFIIIIIINCKQFKNKMNHFPVMVTQLPPSYLGARDEFFILWIINGLSICTYQFSTWSRHVHSAAVHIFFYKWVYIQRVMQFIKLILFLFEYLLPSVVPFYWFTQFNFLYESLNWKPQMRSTHFSPSNYYLPSTTANEWQKLLLFIAVWKNHSNFPNIWFGSNEIEKKE